MRTELPSGIVTLVFTDIEGSTTLLHELGANAYAEALAEHRRILREAFGRRGGVEVDTQGDALFYAFADASEAVVATEEGTDALRDGRIHVRVGIHTGAPLVGPEGYVGEDVHLGARIGGAGHGGQVLLSEATSRAANLGDDALQDLGEHRLKDFDEPIRILQLGSGRFPPLKTISNTNLPRPASDLVGRTREVDEVTARVRDRSRLLTLTGPGGTGKTRLAIEAASELVPVFKAGVFWVGLAQLRDPSLVLTEIGTSLGAKNGVAEHIGEREMLLLIDNLEQVIDSAPELATLTEACPNLHLLATSRERLRVRGESEYPVPPLARSEAIELFEERSGVEPDEAVAELCGRLDDMPLAVELAAARTSVLSPARILERLGDRLDMLKGGRDADPRQATLRATIEWSYDMLSADEQRLFAALSVFAGCTLEAAEEVATANLDGLQSLVDKSLLRQTEDRFWMLETIRALALERLDESGERDDLLERHTSYFLALAEEAEPHLFGTHPGQWLERLEQDHDNLRAVLDRLHASGDAERSLRMAGALAEFWGIRGHLKEGLRRLESALAADEHPTAARAKALNGAADLAHGVDKLRYAQEGLELNRTLGRRWGTADSLLLLGIAHNNLGDFAQGRPFIEEAIPIYADLGDEHGRMEATRFLAWASSELGDVARAQELLRDNVRGAKAAGDIQIEERSLDMLAGHAIDEGRGEEALRLLEEAFRLNQQLGDAYWTPIIICRLGGALVADGRAALATTVLSAGEALLETIGEASPWITEMNGERLAAIRATLDDDAFAEAWERGRALTAGEAVALALGNEPDA